MTPHNELFNRTTTDERSTVTTPKTVSYTHLTLPTNREV
mgnify:CR=1 FL=1